MKLLECNLHSTLLIIRVLARVMSQPLSGRHRRSTTGYSSRLDAQKTWPVLFAVSSDMALRCFALPATHLIVAASLPSQWMHTSVAPLQPSFCRTNSKALHES